MAAALCSHAIQPFFLVGSYSFPIPDLDTPQEPIGPMFCMPCSAIPSWPCQDPQAFFQRYFCVASDFPVIFGLCSCLTALAIHTVLLSYAISNCPNPLPRRPLFCLDHTFNQVAPKFLGLYWVHSVSASLCPASIGGSFQSRTSIHGPYTVEVHGKCVP